MYQLVLISLEIQSLAELKWVLWMSLVNLVCEGTEKTFDEYLEISYLRAENNLCLKSLFKILNWRKLFTLQIFLFFSNLLISRVEWKGLVCKMEKSLVPSKSSSLYVSFLIIYMRVMFFLQMHENSLSLSLSTTALNVIIFNSTIYPGLSVSFPSPLMVSILIFRGTEPSPMTTGKSSCYLL